jgi:hypothetical protein
MLRIAVLLRTAVVVLLVAVGALIAGPATAAGSDVSWTVRTASNHFGADRTSYSYNVNPGGTVEDALVVANHGTTPLTLGVYAADGYTTDNGQYDLITKDHRSIGVGAWVRAGQAGVTVKPGQSASLPFTVRVPANATPGDHAGGIVTSLVQADSADNINVDRRLGILIKLRVGGELKPGLAVQNLKVHYAGTFNPFGKGDATISYTIRNTGNAILSAREAASVSGPSGWLRAEAAPHGPAQQLLPGESRTVSVPVSGVAPAGRLAATATLTPLITDAAGSTSSLAPVVATQHGWAISWTLLLLVVILLALVGGGVPLLRRRRRQRTAREDARVQEAVEQALRDQQVDAR